MKIGIIGTGNMGRIMAEALLDSEAIPSDHLLITNRTINKAEKIKEMYNKVVVYNSGVTIAKEADLIFLCVKPQEVFQLANELIPSLTKDKCVVSITSPITAEQLESIVPCSVARVIPSITNRALSGISLLSFGANCTTDWKQSLTALLNKISTPLEIDNNITRIGSDIVSCGPAFFSYLAQRFIDSAVEETSIDQETATKLTSEMLIGLGELLQKEYYTLPTLVEKVCVKGGITGEGIKVLESELGDVFNHLFQATHLKFEEDLAKIKAIVAKIH